MDPRVMILSNELRWNPILGTWIVVSSRRAVRPWRRGECPFCPGAPETGYGWDVLVLDNRYPALRPDARPSRESRGVYIVRPGYGFCKVVVETPEHEGDLDTVPFANLAKYIAALAEVTRGYCGEQGIEYVLPFRNKGKVIGVSLTHPHSQVYILPFVPPRVRRELECSERFYRENNACLFCRVLEQEREEGGRLLYENPGFAAFLPFFAMWPYEVHVYPKRHFQRLTDLSEDEVRELADALRVVVAGYNSLFGFSLPYMMIFHQAPCRGDYAYYHFHVEFYPVHRAPDKLKYAAGIEWGGWVFTYDALPEEKAAELREAFARGLSVLRERGYEPLGDLRWG